jgi:hypothetical protein
MTVAPMAKKDAVSKRLAEEIDRAKHIKNSKIDWIPKNADKEALLNWLNSGPDKCVLLAARDGDWEPLARYLEAGELVTPDIRKFLIELLRGDRKRPNNRHSSANTLTRDYEIAEFVMKLEDSGKRRGVIAAAETEFHCSRGTVQRALEKHRTSLLLMGRRMGII